MADGINRSVYEISEEADIPKSSAYRIITDLEYEGIFQRSGSKVTINGKGYIQYKLNENITLRFGPALRVLGNYEHGQYSNVVLFPALDVKLNALHERLIENGVMWKIERKIVIQCLRGNKYTKRELASAIGTTYSHISESVNKLIEKKIVTAKKVKAVIGGPKKSLLSINPEFLEDFRDILYFESEPNEE